MSDARDVVRLPVAMSVPSWAGRPLRAALGLLALVALGIAFVFVVGVADHHPDLTVPIGVFAGIGVANVWIGALAWARRPHNRTGLLLCAAGFLILAAVAGNLEPVVVQVAGTVFGSAPIAALLHLVLAFPSGRLGSRTARLLAVSGYLLTIGGTVARLLVFPGESGELGSGPFPDAEAFAWAERLQDGLGTVVLVLASLLAIGRLRSAIRSGRPAGERRVRALVYVWGIGSLWFLPLAAHVLSRFFGWDPVQIFIAQIMPFLIMPFVFSAGILAGGFAPAGRIEELGAWLGTDEGGRPPLRDALAATLGDPSLRLIFPGTSGWLTAQGRPVAVPVSGAAGPDSAVPTPPPGRDVVVIGLDEDPVAAIEYDATVLGDGALVAAAGNVVALALERERLTAELAASRDHVRASRARLLEVADAERRKVATDLHDGLQVRLVTAVIHAGRLGSVTSGPDVSPAAREAAIAVREALDAAIEQLRALVQGVMPATLITRGLVTAAEDLLDRVPVTNRLTVSDDRVDDVPPHVAASAYYVLAEAITNTVKHSRASTLHVRLGRDADRLQIEVRDDGVGGAVGGGPGSTGLRGLADRVEALDGRLAVVSPVGGGTVLTAEIPCAS